MKNVDLIYDLIDEAALIYYENLNVDYLEALVQVKLGLIDNQFDSRLNDESIKKLELIYNKFEQNEFLNEEVRLALELLIIKAFKHIDYPLNLMTPDFINYLMSVVINGLFKEDITILDTVVGTGNMLGAIANNYHGNASLIGIENNKRLTELVSISMDLQSNEAKIYFQDALNKVLDVVDVVIGDLDSFNIEDNNKINDDLYLKGIRYFPYLVMASRLENILDNGYFIYLIDNDFFTNKDNKIFKEYIDKYATLCGLIVLPKELFKDSHIGKSILIGKKSVQSKVDLMIVEVKGLSEDDLKTSIEKINIMIDKI